MALAVKDNVEIALGYAVIQPGFKIDQYALVLVASELYNALIRQRAAGVRAGAADLPDKAAVRRLVERAG